MEDTTDSNFFNFFFTGDPSQTNEVISSKIPVCSKYDDFYNLTHKNRGVALIFNQINFDDKKYQKREGTEKDRNSLVEVLTKLDFDVRIHDDYKFGEIYTTLTQVAREDHTHNDCLVVFVMSHGDDGKIYARDLGYPPNILWKHFTGDNCQTLAGKPKMFFIQACRGENVDDGVSIRSKTSRDSSSDDIYVIPAMADILVMYSTYEGYYSWRSASNGSWFIQCLCEVFEKHGNEQTLLNLLTMVNRRVSIEFESFVPNNFKMDRKKQVCTVVSMLTRLMAFPNNKKNNNP